MSFLFHHRLTGGVGGLLLAWSGHLQAQSINISQQPTNLTVLAGNPASFAVTATGSGPLSYQWSKGGTNLPGATNPTYSIPSTQTGDRGSYRVVVSTTGLARTSSVANLYVNQKVTGIIRDFKNGSRTGGHPDFDTFIGTDRGMVQTQLGTDDKPVYRGNPRTPTTTGKANFDQWFRNTPGTNQTVEFDITLSEDPARPGIYVYDNQAFFPIDGRLFGNQQYSRNFSFTYELHLQFTYRPGDIFLFRGDDDVWVFLNNRLAIDLGGVHGAEQQSVSLDTIAASFGMVPGQTYPMDIFFAERHYSASSFRIETSLSSLSTRPPDPAVIYLSNLVQIADGNPKSVTVTTSPLGLPVTVTYNGSSTPPSAVGTYSVNATINDPSFTGSAAATLQILSSSVPSSSIELSGLEHTYDGQAKPVSASAPGLTYQDFRIEYEAAGYPRTTNAPVNAGIYQVTATVIRPGMTGSRTATMNIARRILNISANSQTRLVGENNAPLTYVTDGWAANENESVLDTPVIIGTAAQISSAPGNYEITVSGASDPNYQIVFRPGNLLVLGSFENVITFSPLAPRVYGDAPFSLGGSSVSGLPVTYTSDNPSVASISGGQVVIHAAGTAAITAAQPGNSAVPPAVPVTQTLIVQPKLLTNVTGISTVARAYDGTRAVDLNFSNPQVTGALPGDEVTLVASGATGFLVSPAPGLGLPVMVTGLALAGADAANYALGAVTLSVNIARRGLTVQAENQSRPYLQANPEFSWLVASGGLALGDYLEIGPLTTPASNSSLPGNYPIEIGAVTVRDAAGVEVTHFYNLNIQNALLTVQKGIQAIDFPAIGTKTYGDPSFGLLATSSNGRPVVFSSGDPDLLGISGTNATIQGGGSVTVTATLPGDEVWDPAPPVTATFNILPRGIVVAARSQTIQAGETPVLDFDILTPLAYADTKAGVFSSEFVSSWLKTVPAWNPSLIGDFRITRNHGNQPNANYEIVEFREGILSVLPGAGVADNSVAPLAGGYNHSLLLRTDGFVSAWGSAENGVTDVPGALGDVAGVAAGNSGVAYSLAWKGDGTVAGWGSNSLVVNPAVLGSLTHVVGLAGGANHALALKSDGTVSAWGANDYGQTTVSSNLADTNHGSFLPSVAVAASGNYSLALQAQGTVRSWGVVDASVAGSLSGLTNAVGIAAGNNFVLTLHADGSVRYHGPADNLGIEVLPDAVTDPVLLGTNPVVGIAAGSTHALAMRRDGSVVAWGYGPQGQTNVPNGLSQVAAVAAGQSHSLALQRDGTVVVFAIGSNLNQTLRPNGPVGALPRGGPDSDGDGWSNEAELRAGSDPLASTNRPKKLVFSDGTFTRTVTEGPAGTVLGTLRGLDRMGWPYDNLPANLQIRGPDANKVAISGSDLVAAVDLDYEALAVAGRTQLAVILEADGLTEQFVITLADNPADNDADGDGLTYAQEMTLGTDPTDPDSDGDGFGDGVETGTGTWVSASNTGTLPLNSDTDEDGLLDGVETNSGLFLSSSNTGTHPLDRDTDDDGLVDGVETHTGIYLSSLNTGTNPLDADSDNDGILDGAETNSALYVSGANTGTNPLVADTDGDGLSDGVETNSGLYVSGGSTGTHPLVADTDGDGKADGVEIAAGVSPFSATAYPDKPVEPPQFTVAANGEVNFSYKRILPLGGAYQLQSSPDLISWTDVGSSIPGTGTEVQLGGVSMNPRLFYRVITIP